MPGAVHHGGFGCARPSSALDWRRARLADALGLLGELLVIVGDVEKSAPSFDIAPSDGLRTGLSRPLAPIFGSLTVSHGLAPP
jgi:hypothetical protein